MLHSKIKKQENEFEKEETARKSIQTELDSCNTDKATLTQQKATLETQLATCNTEKTAAIQEKTLWQTRFTTVKQLENDHVDFSVQAMNAHPGAEATVGNGVNAVNCDHKSTSVVEKVGLIALGGMLIGLGLKLTNNKSEEKVPLLEI